MTSDYNSEVNAGVHNILGTNFQKICTIYLFLEKYKELKNQRYFIALEHHEDIVFGYLDSESKLSKIETYQAKKSTSKWTLNDCLEVIKKIAETSQSILDDPEPKTNNFAQENYFATNNTIELNCKIMGINYKCTVNESNEHFKYTDLNQNIKNKIIGNESIKFTTENVLNLESLHFRYMDLSRTSKAQLNQLIGNFSNVFGESILDYKAALYTFYNELNIIESELNQGGVAILKDRKKRIESTEVNNILNILTSKKLAFEFWRNKSEGLCEELDISVSNRDSFKLHYENSFDKFKDIKESEHRKILNFVINNKQILDNHTTDKACVSGFLQAFKKEKSSTLLDLQLKAIITAAYFEIRSSL